MKSILFLCLWLLPCSLLAQTGDELLTKLRKKYATSDAILVTYYPESNVKMKTTIKAAKGNKYVLDVGDRVITSNGTTVWNYSRNNNTVVLSTFREDNISFSVEKLFFTVLNNWTVGTLSTEQTAKSEKFFVLPLLPPAQNNVLSSIARIDFYISPSTFDAVKVRITQTGTSDGTTTYVLQSVLPAAKFPASTFEYTPPAAAKIVDLRK